MKYIGARYMPKFTGLYDATTAYEALSVVDNGMGTSYVANKPVPAGTPLTDTDYWAIYGSTSGAIINLQNQIDDIRNTSIKFYNTVSDLVAADVSVGDIVETLGYYAAGDGGAAQYEIKATSTDIYITLTNGLVAELIYEDTINVLQLGAVGDDLTDDTAAFTTALANAKEVIVPYGNNNKYRLTGSLTVGLHNYLHGDVLRVAGDYPMLNFITGGIIINDRECKVEALAITTDSSSIGIYIDTSLHNIPYIEVKDVYIYQAQVGLKTEGSKAVWMSKFENVRVNYCALGYELTYVRASTFIGCYVNRCTPGVAKLRNSKCEFISCNFGFIDAGSASQIDGDSGNEIDFIGCNFECDEHITGGAMIEYRSNSVRFRNCKFTCNGAAAACCVAFGASCQSAVFDMCGYTSATGNDPAFEFIAPTHARTAKYGGLVYGKGCFSLPRPAGSTPSAYKPCLLDLDNNDIIHFIGTTIDTTKLVIGTILWSDTQGKLCYYNGTNVIAIDGTIIV